MAKSQKNDKLQPCCLFTYKMLKFGFHKLKQTT